MTQTLNLQLRLMRTTSLNETGLPMKRRLGVWSGIMLRRDQFGDAESIRVEFQVDG